jgi:DHA2 family multidrug resistance protein
MFALLRLGVRPDPPIANAPKADVFGLATSGVGLALIYAALDQGNRLDWLNSGLIWGLLLSGAILVALFFIHERRTPHPVFNLEVAARPPLPRLLIMIGFLRLTILSTAYLIPQYLGAVRGFRALEVGQTLIWIAAPQLIICPVAALLLRRVDPRLISSVGFVLIAIACLIVAHGLTSVWGSDQFLPSQLLQAVGQSLALSGVIFFGVLHLKPEDALTFGAALQTARLMGGQIGTAFIVTLVRVRSQIASNLIGLHINPGDPEAAHRLAVYAAATSPGSYDPSGPARAAAVLGGVVRSAAATQGVIDGFVVIGGLTALCLLLLVAHRPAPIGPASHLPLFAPRPGPPVAAARS